MIRVTNRKEMFLPIVDMGEALRVSFDFEPFYDVDAEGNKISSAVATWTEAVLSPRPSFNQIKTFIINAINKRTDEKILSGFIWKDMQVWLSSENQFNYKAAYDLAVQTNGESLPVVFKFGNETPVYYRFDTVEELYDFYSKAMSFINEQLAIGWNKKDSINWEDYRLKE